jgi:hypothetical protein
VQVIAVKFSHVNETWYVLRTRTGSTADGKIELVRTDLNAVSTYFERWFTDACLLTTGRNRWQSVFRERDGLPQLCKLQMQVNSARIRSNRDGSVSVDGVHEAHERWMGMDVHGRVW